ncbi:MAG: YraN family protein [Verrucomicrobiota bacterium]
MKFIHKLRESILGSRRPQLPENATRAERGQFGEDLAAVHCRRVLGYRVITRNWRHQKGEIDLVCRDAEVLVFIEVRSRSAEAAVSGYNSVDPAKKDVLRKVFRSYLKQLPQPPKHFRFDIIDIALVENGESEVRHYKNVPLFHKHFSV